MIKNSYSFWGYLRLAIFVIRTKFISSKARIIRFPIEIYSLGGMVSGISLEGKDLLILALDLQQVRGVD